MGILCREGWRPSRILQVTKKLENVRDHLIRPSEERR
jgi:hypothetical protein